MDNHNKIWMYFIPLFIFVPLLCGCQQLEYVHDTGLKTAQGEYLSSGRANSPEFPVLIAGTLCKDMDGIMGTCVKRWTADPATPFKFTLPKRPYAYTVTIQCSSWVHDIDGHEFPYSKTILADKDVTFTVGTSDRNEFKCVGEVFPKDRDDSISAKFTINVILVHKDYLPREVIYKVRYKGDWVVLGEHALYSDVDGKQYKKKTVIKDKPEVVKAITESYLMRFNQYGI